MSVSHVSRMEHYGVRGRRDMYALARPDIPQVRLSHEATFPGGKPLDSNAAIPGPFVRLDHPWYAGGPGWHRLVRTLADDRMAAGTYRVIWNGDDEAGKAVATGLYFYELRAGSRRVTRQLIWVR